MRVREQREERAELDVAPVHCPFADQYAATSSVAQKLPRKAIPAGGRHQAHSSSAVMAVAKARAKARRRGQVALTKGLETAAAASVA